MKTDWIAEVENKIGYVFRDKKLLQTCFSHSSYTNEHGGENNERLEFLGDALLGGVVADDLYRNTCDHEGKMTEKRKALVAALPLKKAIERMGLEGYILAGGDGKNVGEKAISSLFEAIVAGIYLDGGIAAAQKFIRDKLLLVTDDTQDCNYIGKLQEYTQCRKIAQPIYDVIKSGEEHAPVFAATVRVCEITGKGTGKRSRDAKQNAAKNALDILEKERGEKIH